MAILEVPLRQNHNAMLVDLFTERHARRVLAEFGAAYDRLPANASEFTAEQNAFLDRAVADLSDGGKIFPVRLVAVRGNGESSAVDDRHPDRSWAESTDWDFSSWKKRSAASMRRSHNERMNRRSGVCSENCCRRKVSISKATCSRKTCLLDESGYQDQPALFDEMMRILDNELRLVTPTDPAGTTTSDDSISQSSEGQRYYQLTHDYLVPAIEQWLTRKERETHRGRAELRLAEYASLWSSKPTAQVRAVLL